MTYFKQRVKVLDSQYTTVGNIGTGEDDLMSFAIPASTLLKNGDSIEVQFGMAVANNANQKRIRVYLGGGSAIFDTGATGLAVSTAYSIKFNLLILKDGSSTQKWYFEYFAGSILGVVLGTLSLTDTNTITVKATGETNAASNNDVTQTMMITTYYPLAL